jgi:O-antigen ligase
MDDRRRMSRLATNGLGQIGPVVLGLAIVYAVLLGGSAWGELHPLLRIANATLAAMCLVTFIVRARRYADRLETAIVLATAMFAVAGVLAVFPRQALDATLAALTYAAVFILGREILTTPRYRAAAIWSLRVLFVFFTLVFTVRWVPTVLEWWRLTDWSVVPPLDMRLSAAPWGHRHDLALAIAMLFPSWLVGRWSPTKAAVLTVTGILAVILIVIDGSRTLWLAMGIATVIIAAPTLLEVAKRHRNVAVSVAGAAGLLAGGFFLTGVGGAFADRLLTVGTLSARSEMWSALTSVWLSHPIAGIGPGAFPWALQLSDFFDTNAWAPRHPDSLVFQLLPEAGLLGVAAVALLAVVLLPAVLTAGHRPAAWALLTFAVAGIGSNPTDFAFLVVIAIVWASIALPSSGRDPAGRRIRWMTISTIAAAAVVGVAYAATLGAAVAYERARALIHDGHAPAATRDHLATATGLDPGLTLYLRQLGTARLLSGDPAGALAPLRRATEQNPFDDLAWRALALALAESGNADAARMALDQAVKVQRSDVTNLLLRARLDRAQGHGDSLRTTIAELVQGWPALTVSPGWDAFLGGVMSSTDAVELAIERWLAGSEAPTHTDIQALTLTTMGNRRDLALAAAGESNLSERLLTAYRAVHTCDPDADQYLEATSDADRRQSQYWALLITHAGLSGTESHRAIRQYAIMTGGTDLSLRAGDLLHPLRENDASGFSADAWGYRRPPISWPPWQYELPSPQAGAANWILALGSSHDGIGQC